MAVDCGAVPPHTRAVAIATPPGLSDAHVCIVLDLAKSEDLFSWHFGIVDVAHVPQYTPLIVTDVGRSFRFYGDLVGLKPLCGDEDEEYAEFSLGSGKLALAEPSALPRVEQNTSLPVTRQPRGKRTLTFEVDNVQAARKRLSEAGVNVQRSDQEWVTAFDDPDGNRVQIMPH
jgi:catechol 2,3-dioxygenase-like lactoylglutathione lyase family enzyme